MRKGGQSVRSKTAKVANTVVTWRIILNLPRTVAIDQVLPERRAMRVQGSPLARKQEMAREEGKECCAAARQPELMNTKYLLRLAPGKSSLGSKATGFWQGRFLNSWSH